MDRCSTWQFPVRSATTAACILLVYCLAGLADDAAKSRDGDAGVPSKEQPTEQAEPPRGPFTIVGQVVNEGGTPEAGVAVRMLAGAERPTTVTDADGTFRFPWSRPGKIYGLIIGQNADRTRQGTLKLNRRTTDAGRLTLKPAREVNVTVTDVLGAPVDAARVLVLDTSIWPLANGVTGIDGRLLIRIPADTVVGQVAAYKSGAGFDYYSTLPAKQSPERNALPDNVALKLSGARIARVKAVDGAGDPVAGLNLFPWYINQKDKPENMNLAGSADLVGATTDPGGVATFDWLPADFDGGISFLVRSSDYHPLIQASIKDDGNEGELTLPVLRKTKISGRVTFADGRPAAKIAVSASGAGKADHSGHAQEFTGDDGSYEMLVNSEEMYIVSVVDDRWAAPSRDDVVVREGKSVDGLDFALREGTIVRGKVTLAPENRPVPKAYVSMIQSGGKVPAELQNARGMYRAAQFYHEARTDEEGNYRFCIGPGKYTIGGTELVIAAQPEIIHDIRQERPATGPLLGHVIDAKGLPIAGAIVLGSYQTQSYTNLETNTLSDGVFRVERGMYPAILFAKTSDGTQAGITTIDAKQSEVTIQLGPVASASGRLLSEDGQPLARTSISYGIKVYQGKPKKSPYQSSFGGTVKTDAQGRYELPCLVPGQEYDVTYYHESENRFSGLGVVKPSGTEPIDLADTRLQPKPKPYQPPTVDEITTEFFKHREPINERIARAQDEARRCYLRVLLVLGDPASAASRKLIEVRDQDWSRGTMNDFEQVGVATDDADALSALKRRLGDAVANLAFPALIILDENSQAIGSIALPLDGADKQLAAAAGKKFLNDRALPRLDAEKLLSDALARARREDKPVFLQETATWCGPCRMLSRFIDRHKAVFDEHFVYVKIDHERFAHGDNVMKRLRPKNVGGIPWVAILDEDEKSLGYSEDEDGKNYGFPTKPEEIDHFLALLAKSAPRMTPAQRDELRMDLESKK